MPTVPPADHAFDDVYLILGTFKADEPGGLHALVRSARAGESDAVRRVLEVLTIVPSHLPGREQPLLEAVAEVLAEERGWRLSADALVRVLPAAEAKLGGPRNVFDESPTIDWQRPWPEARVIVMLDDVYRSGASIAACRRAIARAGDSRPIHATALARAATAR
jgi:hypothetical protein